MKGSIEGRNCEVKLMDKAQGFLNGVADLVQLLHRIISSCCRGCHVINLRNQRPISTTPTISSTKANESNDIGMKLVVQF